MNAIPLGEVSDTVMGQAPPGKECNKEGNGTVFVKAGEFSERTPITREWTTKPLKLAKAGDVLVCVVGATAGKVNFGVDCAIGRSVAAVRPKNERLNSEYLFHFLSNKTPQLRAKSQGLAQGVITREMLANLEVPLPPLNEQKRIAAILDQADALRRLRKHAIERLNNLGQAIFHEMFSSASANSEDFRRVELSEVIQKGDKINYGVVQPGDAVEDGVPLVRVGDLLKPLVNKSELKRISKSVEEKYSRSRLNGDEILVACVGSIGAIALADDQMSGFNIARAVARIPVDETKSNRLFLAEQLKTQKVQRYFKSETRAVAQPTLNIKQLKETEIFIPPMKQQLEFSERLEGVRKHLSLHAHAIQKMEVLNSSLQSQAFQGEL